MPRRRNVLSLLALASVVSELEPLPRPGLCGSTLPALELHVRGEACQDLRQWCRRGCQAARLPPPCPPHCHARVQSTREPGAAVAGGSCRLPYQVRCTPTRYPRASISPVNPRVWNLSSLSALSALPVHIYVHTHVLQGQRGDLAVLFRHRLQGVPLTGGVSSENFVCTYVLHERPTASHRPANETDVDRLTLTPTGNALAHKSMPPGAGPLISPPRRFQTWLGEGVVDRRHSQVRAREVTRGCIRPPFLLWPDLRRSMTSASGPLLQSLATI